MVKSNNILMVSNKLRRDLHLINQNACWALLETTFLWVAVYNYGNKNWKPEIIGRR